MFQWVSPYLAYSDEIFLNIVLLTGMLCFFCDALPKFSIPNSCTVAKTAPGITLPSYYCGPIWPLWVYGYVVEGNKKLSRSRSSL